MSRVFDQGPAMPWIQIDSPVVVGRCYTVQHRCLPYPPPRGLAVGSRVLVVSNDHMSSVVVDERGEEWTVSDLALDRGRQWIWVAGR